MQTRAIPLGIHSYQSRSLPWSAQRLINWYAQASPPVPGTKSPVVLLPRYGMVRLSTLSGVCRGSHVVKGILYTVFGTTLYVINSSGGSTSIGTIAGSDPVTFADNGDYVVISANPKAYVLTITGLTLTEITSSGFNGSSSVTFLDGYFIHTTPDETAQFQWSEVSDPFTYDALDFATAESESDPLIRCLERQQELWLFGSRSIEVWATTGDSNSAFQRLQNVAIERGCIATNSVVKTENTVFWIGDDKIVYQARGYQPTPISTDAIARMLNDSTDLENVRGFYHVEDGHQMYTITSVVDKWTLTFDTRTNLWHERSSFADSWTDAESPRRDVWWNAFSGVNAYNSWIVGDRSGGLFKLTSETYTDDSSTIRYEATGGIYFEGTTRIGISRVQIDLETGVGLTTGQGSNPQIMLRFSKDGGRQWSNEHWRTMGAMGKYKTRATWRQLGRCHDIIFNIAVTDPIKPVILGAYADVEVLPP